MNVPCKDHDNCDLDLPALRAAILKVQERMKEIRAALPVVDAARFKEPGYGAAWKKWSEMRYELGRLVDEATRLYSTRAHHRGKVHAPRRRDMSSNDIKARYEVDLDGQESEIATTWEKLKKRPATENAA